MSTCIVVPQPNDDLVVEECKVPVVCSSWDQCWSRPACVYGSSKMPARSWQSCTATVSVTLALLWIGLAITLTITITARSAAAQNAAPQAAAQMGAAMAYWSVLKGSATSRQLQHCRSVEAVHRRCLDGLDQDGCIHTHRHAAQIQ